MPSFSSPYPASPRSRIRSTTASPWIIGMTDTRRSMSRPATRSRIRPSCGTRFSAMSRWLRILSRLTIAAWYFRTDGGMFASTSTPSTRYRTRSTSSNGSTWTSVARLSSASCNTWLTNLMMLASWAASVRSRLSSPASSMTAMPSSSTPMRLQRVGTDAEVLLGEPVNFRGRGEGRVDLHPGCQPQLVEAVVVEHLGRDDRQLVRPVPVEVRQRHQPVVDQQPGRQLAEHLLRRGVLPAVLLQVDVRDVVVPGQETGGACPRRRRQPFGGRRRATSRRRRRRRRRPHPVGVQQALVHELFDDRVHGRCHPSLAVVSLGSRQGREP